MCIRDRAFSRSPAESAEQRDGVAANLGGKHVAEVGKERAALQAAGHRGGEQPRDGALALFGLAAQRELAVDDRAAQAALGGVVGGLDAGHAGEAPQRRPAFEQVLREAAVAAVADALARRLLEQRPKLLLERADALKQALAVSVPAELSPGGEQPLRDPKPGRAEVLLGAESLAVGGEVAHLLRDLTAHSERLGAQKQFGAAGLRVAERLFAAWGEFRGDADRQRLLERIGPLQEELRALLEEAAERSARNRRHRTFAKNLLKRWPALWSFAGVPGVEPPDNHAERGLRGAVIYRKLSHGSQSAQGERTIERLLSSSVTFRLQGRSLFLYLIDVLAAYIRCFPIPLLA